MKILNSVMVIVSIILSITFVAYADDGELTPKEMIDVLKSSDSNRQSDALDMLVDNTGRVITIYKTPEIREALYSLLRRIAKSTDTFYNSERTSAPLPAQIMAVMGDYGEIRAIPYLLNNLTLRWGIIDSLALMGQPVVKPMLKKMKNGDSREKSVACQLFEVLLTTKTAILIRRGEPIFNPYADVYTPNMQEKEEIRAELKIFMKSAKGESLDCPIRVLRLMGNPEDNPMLEEADKRNPMRMTPEKEKEIRETLRLSREKSLKRREERRKKGLPEEEPIEGD